MRTHKKIMSNVVTVALAAMAPAAMAGGKVDFGNGKSISVGGGLRTSFTSVDEAAPNGKDASKDFQVDSVRLYVNGSLSKNVGFTFNTDASTDNSASTDNEDIVVLDAIAQFAFSDMFNVWVGRHLPPSDRSNLSGPYYLNAWSFPIAQAFPAKTAGRDDGISVWGQQGGGMLKYQVGLYEGKEGVSNQKDSNLMAGRLTLNLWDPEPGYYNASTYFGAKNILAFGVVYQMQADSEGTSATVSGDFSGLSVDGLMEKKLGDGSVATVEGAFYSYEFDKQAQDKTGYFVLGSYLLAQKTGIGQFQPMARFQFVEEDALGSSPKEETTLYTLGVNYIIDGHDTRISFAYEDSETEVGSTTTDSSGFSVGVQLQI